MQCLRPKKILLWKISFKNLNEPCFPNKLGLFGITRDISPAFECHLQNHIIVCFTNAVLLLTEGGRGGRGGEEEAGRPA